MQPQEDESLDRLSGDWWIYQLRKGQRYSTDDVLTAWAAYRARGDAQTVLDLGSGVGSIGLMVLRLLSPTATLTSVELQERSVSLARRTAALNGVSHRVDTRCADLRSSSVLGASERFDLITANPPFLPPGTGWTSPYPERAAARFELHGDVFDYCRVAAQHLARGGRLCFCHAATDSRPETAAREAGLWVRSRTDVVFREGREPRIALFVCGAGQVEAERRRLCVRLRDGARAPEFVSVLRDLEIAE